MRTKESINNIFINIFSQVILVFLGLVSRKVFLDNLGISYLGINGLLTNVLSMLGLVEGGIGLSIVYNLYKPLAEDDREKVTALIQLYKRAYVVLASVILALSLVLYPFLSGTMKDGKSISDISIIYFIFVAKNMISYLNAHKWSLINADQKGYILARINLVFSVITSIVKIIVLVSTQNYIIYLIIEVVIYLIQNMYNGRIVNARYPYILAKKKYTVDKNTKDNMIKNIKALFLHNLGGYCVFGTDNILISSFIGVATVGIYSNYTMIVGQLSALVNPILDGVGASVGNLIATEDNNKNLFVFNVMYLVNFWIYSFCVIFLYNLLEPFIRLWLGKEYLLNHMTFIVILLNFYLTGLRTTISTFKSKAGLFSQDKYVPLCEGIINLVGSLILIKYFGLIGVFIGTTISTLLTVFWVQPYIVYKFLFNIPVRDYFKKYVLYGSLTVVTCYIVASICKIFMIGDSFPSLIERGIVCLAVPNIIYTSIFYRTKEFKYLLTIFKIMLTSIKMKLDKSTKVTFER